MGKRFRPDGPRGGHPPAGAIPAALALFAVPAAVFAQGAPAPATDSGDTAWVLTSAALVLMMTVPALALFYGGLVRKKNILSTVYYSLSSAIVVTLLWVIGMYSLIFGVTSPDPAKEAGILAWIGDLKYAFFGGIGTGSVHPNAGTVPEFAYSMFQLMFAIITVALISGAIVERMTFIGWFVFMILWSLIVYTPLAHWVWNPEGWLWNKGALDFAGGLVVHTSSGVSALVLVMLLGPRAGFRKEPINPPANIGYVFIGAALLWVGWFGFNAGSAVAANGVAGSAFFVTHVAAATAALVWMVMEWLTHGKPTVVGASTGVVAGLVAITPASGFVDVAGALVIGAVVSIISFSFMAWVRGKLKYDDALDVFSVHGLGGMWGAIATGLFATGTVYNTVQGAFYGNPAQLGIQLLSVVAALAIAVVGTVICFYLTKLLTGNKVKAADSEQGSGLDLSQHGEQIESNA
jgi:ammonium transporter, Amt family